MVGFWLCLSCDASLDIFSSVGVRIAFFSQVIMLLAICVRKDVYETRSAPMLAMHNVTLASSTVLTSLLFWAILICGWQGVTAGQLVCAFTLLHALDFLPERTSDELWKYAKLALHSVKLQDRRAYCNARTATAVPAHRPCPPLPTTPPHQAARSPSAKTNHIIASPGSMPQSASALTSCNEVILNHGKHLPICSIPTPLPHAAAYQGDPAAATCDTTPHPVCATLGELGVTPPTLAPTLSCTPLLHVSPSNLSPPQPLHLTPLFPRPAQPLPSTSDASRPLHKSMSRDTNLCLAPHACSGVRWAAPSYDADFEARAANMLILDTLSPATRQFAAPELNRIEQRHLCNLQRRPSAIMADALCRIGLIAWSGPKAAAEATARASVAVAPQEVPSVRAVTWVDTATLLCGQGAGHNVEGGCKDVVDLETSRGRGACWALMVAAAVALVWQCLAVLFWLGEFKETRGRDGPDCGGEVIIGAEQHGQQWEHPAQCESVPVFVFFLFFKVPAFGYMRYFQAAWYAACAVCSASSLLHAIRLFCSLHQPACDIPPPSVAPPPSVGHPSAAPPATPFSAPHQGTVNSSSERSCADLDLPSSAAVGMENAESRGDINDGTVDGSHTMSEPLLPALVEPLLGPGTPAQVQGETCALGNSSMIQRILQFRCTPAQIYEAGAKNNQVRRETERLACSNDQCQDLDQHDMHGSEEQRRSDAYCSSTRCTVQAAIPSLQSVAIQTRESAAKAPLWQGGAAEPQETGTSNVEDLFQNQGGWSYSLASIPGTSKLHAALAIGSNLVGNALCSCAVQLVVMWNKKAGGGGGVGGWLQWVALAATWAGVLCALCGPSSHSAPQMREGGVSRAVRL